MPKTLAANLGAVMPPELAASTAKAVYGNPLKFIAQYEPGTPERDAVDEAYRHLQRLLCISGIAFACLLFITTMFLDNPILTDKRSIDDTEDFSLGQHSQKEEEASREEVNNLPRVPESNATKVQ